MTTKKKTPATYKAAHKEMKGMSLKDIAAALQEELTRPDPRIDLVARLIGRYNRVDGARRVREVMRLLSKRGKRDVRAALAGNR